MALLYKFIILTFIWVCTSEGKDFKIYWNIPTFMCKSYKISFNVIPQLYGILQNQDDTFRGDQISILYDPGEFPAILQNTTSKEYFYRNHGVPQKGNLSEHLNILSEQIQELIPDPNFSGLAILDFESWRPIFRQNFGTLKPYKTLSMQIEQKAHPKWSRRQVEKEAKRNFEIAGKEFMLETLKSVKKLRPNAQWGYYAFPYCFNGYTDQPDQCAAGVKDENNMIQWMFQFSDAIYPSVYLQERLPEKNRVAMVRGRVKEALRVANLINGKSKPKVYVYHRYVYTDSVKYIDGKETYNILNEAKRLGADGIVLWGSSFDLNTRAKCQEFETYLKEHLGPAIRLLTRIPAYALLRKIFVQKGLNSSPHPTSTSSPTTDPSTSSIFSQTSSFSFTHNGSSPSLILNRSTSFIPSPSLSFRSNPTTNSGFSHSTSPSSYPTISLTPSPSTSTYFSPYTSENSFPISSISSSFSPISSFTSTQSPSSSTSENFRNVLSTTTSSSLSLYQNINSRSTRSANSSTTPSQSESTNSNFSFNPSPASTSSFTPSSSSDYRYSLRSNASPTFNPSSILGTSFSPGPSTSARTTSRYSAISSPSQSYNSISSLSSNNKYSISRKSSSSPSPSGSATFTYSETSSPSPSPNPSSSSTPGSSSDYKYSLRSNPAPTLDPSSILSTIFSPRPNPSASTTFIYSETSSPSSSSTPVSSSDPKYRLSSNSSPSLYPSSILSTSFSRGPSSSASTTSSYSETSSSSPSYSSTPSLSLNNKYSISSKSSPGPSPSGSTTFTYSETSSPSLSPSSSSTPGSSSDYKYNLSSNPSPTLNPSSILITIFGPRPNPSASTTFIYSETSSPSPSPSSTPGSTSDHQYRLSSNSTPSLYPSSILSTVFSPGPSLSVSTTSSYSETSSRSPNYRSTHSSSSNYKNSLSTIVSWNLIPSSSVYPSLSQNSNSLTFLSTSSSIKTGPSPSTRSSLTTSPSFSSTSSPNFGHSISAGITPSPSIYKTSTSSSSALTDLSHCHSDSTTNLSPSSNPTSSTIVEYGSNTNPLPNPGTEFSIGPSTSNLNPSRRAEDSGDSSSKRSTNYISNFNQSTSSYSSSSDLSFSYSTSIGFSPSSRSIPSTNPIASFNLEPSLGPTSSSRTNFCFTPRKTSSLSNFSPYPKTSFIPNLSPSSSFIPRLVSITSPTVCFSFHASPKHGTSRIKSTNVGPSYSLSHLYSLKSPLSRRAIFRSNSSPSSKQSHITSFVPSRNIRPTSSHSLIDKSNINPTLRTSPMPANKDSSTSPGTTSILSHTLRPSQINTLSLGSSTLSSFSLIEDSAPVEVEVQIPSPILG